MSETGMSKNITYNAQSHNMAGSLYNSSTLCIHNFWYLFPAKRVLKSEFVTQAIRWRTKRFSTLNLYFLTFISAKRVLNSVYNTQAITWLNNSVLIEYFSWIFLWYLFTAKRVLKSVFVTQAMTWLVHSVTLQYSGFIFISG
jgi:hypothetical protein